MEIARILNAPSKSFHDFYLLFCGYSECAPLHCFGPSVRPNYLIHFILKGKGKYIVNHQVYELSQGQGFLIEPNVLTTYEADENEPWTYIWIGFNGEYAKNYLEKIGLGGEKVIFQSTQGDSLKNIVMEMLEHRSFDMKNEYVLQSLLYKFFSVLADRPALPTFQNKTNENEYVRKAIDFIQNFYNHQIKLTDIAKFVSLNRSYLSSIFKKETGISIQEYLTVFRLSRAAELLRITDLTIEQVAQSCGYNDPLVFSKNFKKRMNLTPTQYRKLNNVRFDDPFEH